MLNWHGCVMTVVALGLLASGAQAGHKLCVNDATGAARVIEAPERCRRAETSVVIPHEEAGERVKASSYTVRNSGSISLTTADGAIEFSAYCGVSLLGWFARDSNMEAGDAQVFNAIHGATFQAFNDLAHNGRRMGTANPVLPWSGVFTSRHGKAMSRFEITMSEKNRRGDCVVTLFSIGLGAATVYPPTPCPSANRPGLTVC